MTKNPLINAAAAFVYIVVVVSFMNYVSHTLGNKPDTILAPMVFLSLFTLSAASMAFIFFYQPFQLFFDGKKKQAIDLAFKSFAAFGGFTLVIIILLFSGIVR